MPETYQEALYQSTAPKASMSSYREWYTFEMEYSLTTYNIFKLHLPFSRQYIGNLGKKNDFLVLQEWVDSLHVPYNKYYIATQETFTLPLKQEKTGTATISSFPIVSEEKFLSNSRELGFTTHKSALLTSYTVKGKRFTILNAHALNFVGNATWYKNIDSWIMHIPLSGACIVAGDFNTWNPWRFKYLQKKLESLGFAYAEYDHTAIIRVDHIWYRNIIPTSCRSHSNVHSSDHYPVTLTFKFK